MSRGSFNAWIALTAMVVFLQSAVHLLATGPFGEIDSIVDLDHSNGIPDVVSTAVIAAAGIGAGLLAGRTRRWQRLTASLLAVCLVVLAIDDVVGVDRDFRTFATLGISGLAIVAVAAFAAADVPIGVRPAVTLMAGLAALVATLVVGQLPELEQWFERARGDQIIELQIVAKQGLELLGWALVALGLFDRAVARGPASPTGPPVPDRA
jgi:hypothetical protein